MDQIIPFLWYFTKDCHQQLLADPRNSAYSDALNISFVISWTCRSVRFNYCKITVSVYESNCLVIKDNFFSHPDLKSTTEMLRQEVNKLDLFSVHFFL